MNAEIDNHKVEADKKMWKTARWGVNSQSIC